MKCWRGEGRGVWGRGALSFFLLNPLPSAFTIHNRISSTYYGEEDSSHKGGLPPIVVWNNGPAMQKGRAQMQARVPVKVMRKDLRDK
jgi:hypothetical protein